MPFSGVIDVVHPLHCDGVAGGGGAVAHHGAVPPPVPVGLDHRAHLAVEEAVGECYEEPLERNEETSCEDKHLRPWPCCFCVLARHHEGDEIRDA